MGQTPGNVAVAVADTVQLPLHPFLSDARCDALEIPDHRMAQAEASVWSWFHAAMEEGLPFHFMRVQASSRSRTPLSSPMSAWKTLKVEQEEGGFRSGLC